MQPISAADAVQRIATARCDFEKACGNIGQGPDKDFLTHEACMNKWKADVGDDLRPHECPSGVDSRQVDTCVAELRAERCGNVLDTVSRLTACRTSALCVP
jgi:hypothetical protein